MTYQDLRAWQSGLSSVLRRLVFLLLSLLLGQGALSAPMLGAFTDGDDAWGKEGGLQQLESYLGLQRNSMAALQFGNNDSWDGFYSNWRWNIDNWQGANSSRTIVWSIPLTVRGTPLSDVANGNYDDYFWYAAQQIAQHYPNSIIRIGWEFNLSYSIWSAVDHPDDYIRAFQRVSWIFKHVSGGFRIDWCPNVGTQGIDPERAYPGDDSVDIIGMDYYDDDWSNAQARWDYNMNEARGLAWHAQFASQHGKPMSFPEFGAGKGGDDPYFITQMFNWVNSHNVAYLNYWDANADYPAEMHWNLYPNIGAEFKRTFATYAGGSGSSQGGGNPTQGGGNPPPSNGVNTVGQVVMQNQQTGLCWDTMGQSSYMSQYYCNWGDNQKFDVLKYSDGSYAFRSVANGQCLNVWGDSRDDGGQIGFYNCEGADNSRFWIWNNNNGQPSISGKNSNKCLDSGWYNYGVGSPSLVQYGCWGGPNQSFNLNFTWGGY